MKKWIFLVGVLVISLNNLGYAQLNQPKEEKNPGYIDIGGSELPTEGKRLSEEELEKVREEIKAIQNNIKTSVSARNAQNAVKAARSAAEAQSTLNSINEMKSKP